MGNLTACISVTGCRTSYEYDVLGRNTAVVDDDGNRIEYTYGTASELLSVKDSMGRITSYEYDKVGNVVCITYPDSTTYKMAYDARSRLISETDAKGNVTTYTYDNANRLISVTDAIGNVTEYEYNNLGELCKVTNAKGNSTTYGYDTLGRRSFVTDSMGNTRTYEYDETGNLIKETSHAGKVTEYVYDQYDRLEKIKITESGTGPQTLTTTYKRDAYGRITDITDKNGTISYSYDAFGRVEIVTDINGDTLQYTYDEYGRKASVKAIQGNSTENDAETDYGTTYYEYDKYSRLIKVSDSFGNSTEYTYNTDDTLAEEKSSNGIHTTYCYDECGFLSSIKTVDKQNTTVAEYHYTRGTNGEITAIEETMLHTDGTVTGKNTSYTYDNVNRLVKEVISNDSGSITFTYGYDENYNRTSQKVEFTGNTDDFMDETGKEEIEAGETVYTYNSCNQLISATGKFHDGTVEETQYEYDLDGNLIKKSSTDSTAVYTYDSNGAMVSATVEKTVDGITVKTEENYGYDAEGVRVFKESDGVKTTYVIDKSETYTQVLAERKSTGEIFYYTRGNGLNSRTEKITGEKTFYLSDGHGNIRTLTDTTGNVTDCYNYNAYGVLLTKEGNTENSYLYCGEQMDNATGLYYLRARYLNSFTGTFTQKDTYEGEMYSPVTQNGYLYTAGNPVMYVDPSGNDYTFAGVEVAMAGRSELDSATSMYYLGILKELTLTLKVAMETYQTGVIATIGAVATLACLEEADVSLFAINDEFHQTIIENIPAPGPVIETLPGYGEAGIGIWVTPIPDQKTLNDYLLWAKKGKGSSKSKSKGGKENTGGSSMPVKDKTTAENGLEYQSNPKHTPGQQGFNPKAGKEPQNSLELFNQSVPSPTNPNQRFAFNKETGAVHRFFTDGNNTWHWCGSTDQGVNSLTGDQIPNLIKTLFGLSKKGW